MFSFSADSVVGLLKGTRRLSLRTILKYHLTALRRNSQKYMCNRIRETNLPHNLVTVLSL